jgi:hypothetical protein
MFVEKRASFFVFPKALLWAYPTFGPHMIERRLALAAQYAGQLVTMLRIIVAYIMLIEDYGLPLSAEISQQALF